MNGTAEKDTYEIFHVAEQAVVCFEKDTFDDGRDDLFDLTYLVTTRHTIDEPVIAHIHGEIIK